MQTNSASSSTTHSFGNVLASGNGKGNSSIVTAWITLLIIAGGTIGLCGFLGINLQQEKGEQALHFMLGLGIVMASLVILYATFHTKGLAKTEITVHENGIIGIGCGKYFDANFDLHGFQLTYDRVTSVDTTGTAIIIHAGAQYKCYVKNPGEIQRAIVGQQQKKMS